MELVTGAMGSLIPKLKDLLTEEYKLQTGVKDQVRCLELELESAHAALRMVANVRPDQLDELVKIWAREVREASYGMEDILDTYLVRVRGSDKPNDQNSLLKRLGEKMTGLFKKSKERHKIAGAIEKIMKNLQEVTDRRGRFTIDNIVAKAAASSRTVDPRLSAMYREASQIIGIGKSSANLISKLSLEGDDESNKKMKIVSVVGVGGLGKTTLAKAVYDKLKSQFGPGAFVPVGQDPDMKKVFRDILIELDKEKYTDLKYTMWDERQLIDEIRDFLQAKRYFVVIDDIWEPRSWDERIKLALVENNCGSRIIITTRKFEVAKQANEVYKLESLSHDNSKKLFYTRLFGGEDKCPSTHPDDLSDMILKKCGGVPLAIITMASLLVGKSKKVWYEVCKSDGFSQDKDDRHMENTMHILALSYYDLPSHLKTCLLYLSVFPEDSLIHKDSLIWKWIAEGFVENKPGCGLFEVGEQYFHDLINRSLIEAVNSEVNGIIYGCRVHDMVLDLIVSMSHVENFVSVDGTLSESHTRRLILKNRELDLTGDSTHVNLPQVRSLIVWWCAIDKWALHPRLKQIRVLALEGCTFKEGCWSHAHIVNLLHLRYLRIRGRGISKLSEEIGGLKFLQTLDLDTLGILDLPYSIGNLTRLVCLRAPFSSLPVGVVGKLTALEELQIRVPSDSNDSKRQFVKDLGNLYELRVLKVNITGTNKEDGMHIDLMPQSLGKLQKMQHLTMDGTIVDMNMNAWNAAVLSQDLRCLFLKNNIKFPSLPSLINSAHLPSLSHLDIRVTVMDEQGLKALGGLPELCYLRVKTLSTITIPSTNIEGDGFFQKLRSLVLPHSMVQFVANEDSIASFTTDESRKNNNCRVVPTSVVMPSLEELQFCVIVKKMQEKVVSLDYLPSIRKVKLEIDCHEAYEDEVERQEAALRDTMKVHPNRPALQIEFSFEKHTKRRSNDGTSVSATEWTGRGTRNHDDAGSRFQLQFHHRRELLKRFSSDFLEL